MRRCWRRSLPAVAECWAVNVAQARIGLKALPGHNWKVKKVQTQAEIIEQIPTPPNGNGQRPHNLQLLLAGLQNGSQPLREGVAVAFTSASVGEGVSHVTQLFAVELARSTGRRTL